MADLDFKKISWFVGLIIIFGSHIYMLIQGLPEDQMVMHAWGNLLAGGLIVWSQWN